MQRHHLLPRQVPGCGCFCRLIDALGPAEIGFEDFRCNGMLLPATECAAARLGLPLHRGPHRLYNELVVDRFGQIERGWAMRSAHAPEHAREEALMRLRLLQGALRRRLMEAARRPLLLNRRDPLGAGLDFGELDAMAESLWAATRPTLH